jgi:HemY protein
MTRLFIFLFAVTLASMAAMWFIENDGSIIVEWLGYRIQTSVAFSILAAIIILIICTTLLQLILWLKNFPKNCRKAISERKRDQGLTALTEGFAAIAAGDIKQAKRLTKQAANYLGHIPLTKLLSAQTAQLEGNTDLAKVHYTAMLENKETEIIAIKGLLLQAKKDGDFNKAMFLAEKAVSIQPDAVWAISILLDLYKITGKWANAEQTIKKAAKLGVISAYDSKRSLALISRARSNKLLKAGDISGALSSAKNSYKLLPDFPPVATNYAKILLKNNSKRKAVKVLEKCWKEEPHPKIASLYMEIFGDETNTKFIKHTEKLVSMQPNNIYGHIEIAKAAMASDDFDTAREHLKTALSITETSSICQLMAEVEKRDGGSPDLIRQWLQRVQTARPDPAWVCVECSHITNVWSIGCKECQAFDSLEWGGSGKAKIQMVNEA